MKRIWWGIRVAAMCCQSMGQLSPSKWNCFATAEVAGLCWPILMCFYSRARRQPSYTKAEFSIKRWQWNEWSVNAMRRASEKGQTIAKEGRLCYYEIAALHTRPRWFSSSAKMSHQLFSHPRPENGARDALEDSGSWPRNFHKANNWRAMAFSWKL